MGACHVDDCGNTTKPYGWQIEKGHSINTSPHQWPSYCCTIIITNHCFQTTTLNIYKYDRNE